MTDHRLHAPATLRNRDAILDALRGVLPAAGLVLEVASGSGEHVVHLARNLPGLAFQPSDPSPEALLSIAAWVEAARVPNVRPPLALDASAAPWPVASADAVVCINMVHIAPWSAAEGLVRGAAEVLPDGAPLYLYGAFRRGGVHTAASNEAFDRGLRDRDPRWGVRDLEAVAGLARAAGFAGPAVTGMPANNLGVVFRRVR
jgi:SAM-dependent methyltransferase